MSVFSKVLSVLLLLLSLVYCGATVVLFSHRTNWRDKAEKSQSAYDTYKAKAEDSITTLKTSETTLKDSLSRTESNAKELKLKYDEAQDDRTEKAARIAELERNVTNKDTQLEGKDRVIGQKDGEIKVNNDKIEKLSSRLKESREIQLAAEEKLLIAEDENDNLKGKVEGLHAQLVETKQGLDDREAIIAQLRENGIPVEEIAVSVGPAQPVKGTVLAVKGESDLIMLSVGSDSDVKRGYRFTVYRDDAYIGKVEVEKVFADMCSARILRDFTNQEIKEGDRAATRVY